MSNDLYDYIKNSLSKKIPEAVIKENLLKSGWQEEQIDQVFQELRNSASVIQRAAFTGKGQISIKKLILNFFIGFVFAFVVLLIYIYIGGPYYLIDGLTPYFPLRNFFTKAITVFIPTVVFFVPNIFYFTKRFNSKVVIPVSLVVSILVSIVFYVLLSSFPSSW